VPGLRGTVCERYGQLPVRPLACPASNN